MSSAYNRTKTSEQNRLARFAISMRALLASLSRSVGALFQGFTSQESNSNSRVNISNANIFGLSTELDLLRNNRYNIALVIFFVPYVLFEIPSNVLLKKFKPNVWLSICMFMFGLCTICQGLVTNYSGLLATRFFLGLFETGMFPGMEILIILGMYHPLIAS
jgi:MFS family permease